MKWCSCFLLRAFAKGGNQLLWPSCLLSLLNIYLDVLSLRGVAILDIDFRLERLDSFYPGLSSTFFPLAFLNFVVPLILLTPTGTYPAVPPVAGRGVKLSDVSSVSDCDFGVALSSGSECSSSWYVSRPCHLQTCETSHHSQSTIVHTSIHKLLSI